MVYAIQAKVFFRNTTRRDAVVSALNTRYQQPQFGTPTTFLLTSPAGDPGFVTEARFTSEADRDQLWEDLAAVFGSGINGPVADSGSVAWMHDCTHDQPVPSPCIIRDIRPL